MADLKKYKIQYLSCHSILEYQELKLLTELGMDVFSNGAYADPKGHKDLPRPGVPEAKYFPEYEKIAREFPKTDLPSSLIDPFDIIIVAHTPEWINENWSKMKKKIVIWRTIGQSLSRVENLIRKMRYEGIKIVRMSEMEKHIPDYIGEDAIIPFYQDENDLKDWNGYTKRVINFTQSLKGRRFFCHFDDIMKLVEGFPALIYGTGNDDLGALNGGNLPYDLMKGAMRDNRVFVYGGTWPSPYTLAFQEAMMTGIPIVSIGQKLAEELQGVAPSDRIRFFEIPSIIVNGENGFYSDNFQELRGYIHQLLQDHELAKKISYNARQTAILTFGKEKVKKMWIEFFKKL